MGPPFGRGCTKLEHPSSSCLNCKRRPVWLPTNRQTLHLSCGQREVNPKPEPKPKPKEYAVSSTTPNQHRPSSYHGVGADTCLGVSRTSVAAVVVVVVVTVVVVCVFGASLGSLLRDDTRLDADGIVPWLRCALPLILVRCGEDYTSLPSWCLSCTQSVLLCKQLKAGGKPSTWFPPGGLVEQDISNSENSQQTSARKCL